MKIFSVLIYTSLVVGSNASFAKKYDYSCDLKKNNFKNSKLTGSLILSQWECSRLKASSDKDARMIAIKRCQKRAMLFGFSKANTNVYETYLEPNYVGQARTSGCSTDHARIHHRQNDEVDFVSFRNFVNYFNPTNELNSRTLIKIMKKNAYRVSFKPFDEAFSLYYQGYESPRLINDWCALPDAKIGFRISDPNDHSQKQLLIVNRNGQLFRYELTSGSSFSEIRGFTLVNDHGGQPKIALINNQHGETTRTNGVYFMDELRRVVAFYPVEVGHAYCRFADDLVGLTL